MKITYNYQSKGFLKRRLKFSIISIFFSLLLINSMNLQIIGNEKTKNISDSSVNHDDINSISISAAGTPFDSIPGNFRIESWDTSYVTQAQAEVYAGVLEIAYNKLVGAWNFPDPMALSGQPPIEVTIESETGEYNGWASSVSAESDYEHGVYPDYITQGFGIDHEPLKVAGHELFHICQYSHPGYPANKWVREGMARMIQDKLSNWLDHADGTEAGSSFVGQTQSYLEEKHEKDLTSLTYAACLFWQYYCEQFGTDKTDPDYGVDAITAYWDTNINPEGDDGITMLNKALNYFSPGTTFEDVFKDFSIALYAKDLDDSTVPLKWKFVDDDETDGSGNYGSVHTISRLTLSATGTITGSSHSVESWSNKYYEYNIDSAVKVISIDFDQTKTNNLFWGLLGVKGDELAYSYTVESEDFSRALVNDNYDKIVVVVVGLENSVSSTAPFDFTIKSIDPLLNIENPLNTPIGTHARAGPYNESEQFISIVNVSAQSGAPIHGFTKDNFVAKVGNIDAPVLAAADIYGKYFLQIQAPNQTANGIYNFSVELVNITGTLDFEEPCIEYSNSNFDIMVSIDKSGSMGTNNKIDAAISAGKLFVDSFLSTDQLGVVQFNESAKLLNQLLILDSLNRSTLINNIDVISTGGSTSIGDGLLKSQQELYSSRDNPDSPNHIILLSDGIENTAPLMETIKPYLINNGTTVHVITIGSDATREDLEALAADTDGTYFHAFDPSSGDIPNDLAQIYRSIAEEIQDMERFYQNRGAINPGTFREFKLDVTDDMDEIEFVIHYNATMQPTSIELFDPSLNPVAFNYSRDKSGMGFNKSRIDNPLPGLWTINISVSGASSDLLYLVEASADTDTKMMLLAPKNGFTSYTLGNSSKPGSRLPFLVSMRDSQEIRNSSVYLEVIPPGYKQNNTIFRVPLYDDGNHKDSQKNDGIYGNIYTATSENGTYQYIINATGITNTGKPFNRILTGAFYINWDGQVDLDSDDDGLTDIWESQNGLNPLSSTGINGTLGDPDLDMLLNYEEFFYGTDPLKSDTDYKGESDGSEVLHGRNPLDPIDDGVMKFPHVRVHPGNNHTLLMFSNKTMVPYTNITIYKSDQPQGIFNFIYSGPYVETFNDTAVLNYDTFYYRFSANSSGTIRTGISRAHQAIPKEYPAAAEGNIIINSGSKTTISNLLSIRITTSRSDDTEQQAKLPSEMRFGRNVTEMANASWVPYNSSEFPIQHFSGYGVKFIFAQVRDNQTVPEESPIFMAGIRYGEESPGEGEIPGDDLPPADSATIGIETPLVLFVITVEFLILSVAFYKKKKKGISVKKV